LNKFKESFIYKGLKNIAYPIFAIFVALFVSVFFVMWAKHYNIFQYFTALQDLFRVIWKASFGNKRQAFTTLEYIAPLIFTGLANAFAFKSGLFNIGTEGQFIMGMLAAGIIGSISGLNPILHITLIVVGGMIFGGLWGAVPGILKAKMGINEVINSIMMNYIALNLVNFLVLRTSFGETGKAATPIIQKSAQILRFNTLSRANIGIFIAILFAFLVYWILWKTTFGYEIRAVGFNPHGAEYGGINIAKNTVLAMGISGGIAGVGGALHVSGIMHQVTNLASLPGFGFDGIAVALLAKSNPIGCILTAVLFGVLNSSSKILQLNGIPKEIVAIIQAIIIIFIATDYILKYMQEKKKKKVIING
jgi:simple sugar transport system permease protein